MVVMLDPNCRPRVTPDHGAYVARLRRMLRRADVVKVSTDDLDFIAPDDHGGRRGLLESGATVVLHTDGGRACTSTGRRRREIEVAVPAVEVVDTIGAGDAFGGAFAAWWDQAGLGRDDLGIRRGGAAAAAAVEVAAVSCTRAGAQPPRRDELGEVEPRRP